MGGRAGHTGKGRLGLWGLSKLEEGGGGKSEAWKCCASSLATGKGTQTDLNGMKGRGAGGSQGDPPPAPGAMGCSPAEHLMCKFLKQCT